MRNRLSVTLFGVLFLLGVSQLSAQLGTQGSILGVATDTTGAVIPGAEVAITNVETGQSLATTTNEVGIFEVLGLNRGLYDVSVTLEGFKTWTIERAELLVGQRLRVSPVLEVGDVTEQITVESAGIELIQTEKSFSHRHGRGAPDHRPAHQRTKPRRAGEFGAGHAVQRQGEYR